MTDRELLELAAKAAGLEFDPTVQNQFGLLVVAEDASCQSDQKLWNPLTDDGDALRLAFVILSHAFGREILAADAAQTLPAIVQVLAERFEVAAFMRRLGEEVGSAVFVQLEVGTGGFQCSRPKRTIWMASTFTLKVH